MTTARFPVNAHFDGAGGMQKGSVEIDRETKMFSARRHRSHRTYSMPLSVVADMVVRAIILSELAEKKKAKKPFRRSAA